MKCEIHKDFFEETCDTCRQEYLDMKGLRADAASELHAEKKYKQLTEERAKKLYEDLMLQFLKAGVAEADADRKAKGIVRKQCAIRGIESWPWL